MAEVAIIINVGPMSHPVALGIRGTYFVPGKGDEDFGMLVVRETSEIQDVGGMKKVRNEAIPAIETARDILNYGQDMTKCGLLICAAQPDEPKELLKAEREEREYLNKNKPRIEYERDSESGAFQAVNKQEDKHGAVETKTKLSEAVQRAKEKFFAECRRLVKPAEVEKAKRTQLAEDQRLFAEGEQLYAQENTRKEITLKHQEAARRLGREVPWCYTATPMEDCGACGLKVKTGVAICGHCGAILDDAKAKHYKVGPYDPALQLAAAGAGAGKTR